jgi:hypothetical protein
MLWTPPLGVPIPPIGLTEVVPGLTSWNTPIPGFYCIYEPSGTDVSNQYGCLPRPRKTIPNVLPAGSVVLVIGPYLHPHTSPNTIVFQGTAASPVFIVGTPDAHVYGAWEVTGTYGFLQTLKVYSLVIHDPASFICLRDVEAIGNTGGGGIGLAKWGAGNVSDIVMLRVNVHDCGDLGVQTDIDNHGITINWGQRIWVLDSELARCSGDGVQINAVTQANNPNVNSIYVGRNKSHHNRQEGLWCKWGSNIIFSENECWAHYPAVGALGGQIGVQYGPDAVYIVNNNVHDGNYGIEVASYNSSKGGGLYISGNTITNIRGQGDILDPWAGGAGMLLAGGNNIYAGNNIITNCDGGVQMPAGNAYLKLENNTITGIARASLNIEGTPAFINTGNTFDHPSTWVIGGSAKAHA